MYATVETGFWTDADSESWTADQKLLYLYLFTGPEANGITGTYRLPAPSTIMRHTSLDAQRLTAAMNGLLGAKKIVLSECGWIWVVGRCRYGIISKSTATAAMRHWGRVLGTVPPRWLTPILKKYRPLLKRFGVKDEEINDLCNLSGTVPDTVANTVSYTVPSVCMVTELKREEDHDSSVGGSVEGVLATDQLPLSPENSDHQDPVRKLLNDPAFEADLDGDNPKPNAAALTQSPVGGDRVPPRNFHRLVLPFRNWIADNFAAAKLEPWFNETVNLAFESGVTPGDAKAVVTACPALLLDSKQLTKRMIAHQQDRRSTPALVTYNPDGSVDTSKWE